MGYHYSIKKIEIMTKIWVELDTEFVKKNRPVWIEETISQLELGVSFFTNISELEIRIYPKMIPTGELFPRNSLVRSKTCKLIFKEGKVLTTKYGVLMFSDIFVHLGVKVFIFLYEKTDNHHWRICSIQPELNRK